MIRTGIDITDISRFERMDNLDGFVHRVFTDREREYFDLKKNRVESIAGSFAAKEAFAKYMGVGFNGFSFRDIEILHNEFNKPYIVFMGKKVCADVSISHSDKSAVAVVCGEENCNREICEYLKEYHALLPKRDAGMNKGDCGRVFILAGSRGMTGAAALCANAALRCGSGLVSVGCPDTEQHVLAVKLTEAMTLPLSSNKNGGLSAAAVPDVEKYAVKSDVCAVGPGLGISDGVTECVSAVLRSSKAVLLDADGLNSMAEHIDILKSNHGELVLTPHPGEMSRLCGLSISEIESNRERITSDFAKEYNLTLLLKGKNTVIASPRGEVHINPTGNSGMATGGMGDVLSGVIASFMGQGLDGFRAAVLGAFVHGFAGDIAAREIGEFGMIAGDVVARLPKAINALYY